MKDVTFALMTCGELSEKKCLKAIKPFRNQIQFFELRNVYPQVRALNLMIERTQTDYLIPLDGDIILHPDAWPKIRTALNKHRHDPQWHSILFPLWDTLTEKKILALKLLRTEIMKQHLFKESATPDVEHYQRLADAGYTCIDNYLKLAPMGDHVVKGKYFCYHKYRDVYQTYKAHGFEWDSGAFLGGKTLSERAKAHFHYFLYKWVITGRKDYLWCIAGMADGITSPTENKSKDYKSKKLTYSTQAGIHRFMEWYRDFGNEFQTAHYLF
jgi:hypothetical protein